MLFPNVNKDERQTTTIDILLSAINARQLMKRFILFTNSHDEIAAAKILLQPSEADRNIPLWYGVRDMPSLVPQERTFVRGDRARMGLQPDLTGFMWRICQSPASFSSQHDLHKGLDSAEGSSWVSFDHGL